MCRVHPSDFSKLLYLLPLLFLLPGTARADDLYVDCSGGPLPPGVYPSINAALSAGAWDLHRNYQIFITGTCVEKVFLYARADISFIGQDDNASVESPAPPNRGPVFKFVAATNIEIRRLNIRNGAPGLQLLDQSAVRVYDITLEGNNLGVAVGPACTLSLGTDALPAGRGILLRGNQPNAIFAESSFISLAGATIESNAASAISMAGGRLWLLGVNKENVIQNNGSGIDLKEGASASIQGQNTILSNHGIGISLAGSVATISEVVRPGDDAVRATTIEGHSVAGVTASGSSSLTIRGRHKIRNNGSVDCPVNCGGLRVLASSSAVLGWGVEMTNNVGSGVVADQGSSVSVNPTMPWPPRGTLTITGNTDEDVLLTLLSVARVFNPDGAGTIVIGTLSCDESSALGGDLAGIGAIRCKGVVKDKHKRHP